MAWPAWCGESRTWCLTVVVGVAWQVSEGGTGGGAGAGGGGGGDGAARMGRRRADVLGRYHAHKVRLGEGGERGGKKHSCPDCVCTLIHQCGESVWFGQRRSRRHGDLFDDLPVCHRLCRWLRVLGVDVELWRGVGAGGSEGGGTIVTRARATRRMILTRDGRLAASSRGMGVRVIEDLRE
jgi:hypothetical protein